MSLSKKLLVALAPVSMLALSACATGFPAQVSRFQAMPAPQGQTFVILPQQAEDRGSLEFAQYAGLAAQHLQALGYRAAAPGEGADLVVALDYGVDPGRQEVQVDPFRNPRYGALGWRYRPYYSRFGYFGRYRSPFYYGWHDPFWYDDGITARTVYTSYLDMDIRRADGQAVFEGLARARSGTDDLTLLVPNLIEAMFTGFPGNSGETVRITVPTPRR